MARLLGPDTQSRQILRVGREPFVRTARYERVLITTDEAGQTPAAILAYDPQNPDTPGAAIADSRLTLDGISRAPLFWFPDGVTTVYAQLGDGKFAPLQAVGAGGGGADEHTHADLATVQAMQDGDTAATDAASEAYDLAAAALPRDNGVITDSTLVVKKADGSSAFRVRSTGGGVDYDIFGNLVFSAFQDFDNDTNAFQGEQIPNLRLRHGGGTTLAKRTEFGTTASTFENHIDPGIEALLGGKNASDPIKFCGVQPAELAAPIGYADVGDVVLTRGGWYYCTANGDPATWQKMG